MRGSFLSKRFLGTLACAAGLAVLAGCPHPQDRFDEFVDRSAAGAGRGGSGGTGGVVQGNVADLSGRFLLAVSAKLNPTAPLLFDATLTMTLDPAKACPPGACSIDFTIQPLANKFSPVPGCPPHLTPVGPVVVLDDVPVDETGSFTATFVSAEVNGCANPISGGDIEATLVLLATTRSADLFCGPVEGAVVKPLTLNLKGGSNFAAVRLTTGDPATDPAGVNPIFTCPASTGTGGSGGEGGAGGGGGGGGA